MRMIVTFSSGIGAMLLILGCGRGPTDSVIGSDYSGSTSADQESTDRLKKAAGEDDSGDLVVSTEDSGDIRNLIDLVAGADPEGHGGSHSDQITHDIEQDGDSDSHSDEVTDDIEHEVDRGCHRDAVAGDEGGTDHSHEYKGHVAASDGDMQGVMRHAGRHQDVKTYHSRLIKGPRRSLLTS